MNKLNVVAVTLVTVGLIPVGAGLLAQQPKRGGAGQRNGQSGQTTLTDMTPANPVIRAIVEARLATSSRNLRGRAWTNPAIECSIYRRHLGLVASLDGSAAASQPNDG